jgi:glycosyltransferase involved in cell wall biosynthesis
MGAPRIAVVATGSSSGEAGGAERFYVGLRDAMLSLGAQTEIITIVSDESTFETIQESYLRFYDLDLSDYDGVISTKAPSYVISHPNHVCYLVHTMRVFYDMFDAEFPNPSPLGRQQRQQIQEIDTAALRSPRIRRRFVIGHEVGERLRTYNGLDAEVLYPASNLSGFWTGGFRYLFMPGRLHRWKRADLAIRAMRYVKAPVELLISGIGEEEAKLKELAGGDRRVRFLGRVTDVDLVDLYANALAVPFVPVREDFGLVTLEAFSSRKPVITCADSGEPARIVQDGVSGFVCAAEPQAIGQRIQSLCDDPDLARRLGEAGAVAIRDIQCENLAKSLASALGFWNRLQPGGQNAPS